MSPKGAGRQVPRITLLPGLCLEEKLTVTEKTKLRVVVQVVGRGAQSTFGVRTETLLPEDLFGARTPKLDLVTVSHSLNFHVFQGKEMA